MVAPTEFDDNLRVERRVRPQPEPAAPPPRRDRVVMSSAFASDAPPSPALHCYLGASPCIRRDAIAAYLAFSISDFRLSTLHFLLRLERPRADQGPLSPSRIGESAAMRDAKSRTGGNKFPPVSFRYPS